MMKLVAAAAFLALNYYVYAFLGQQESIPERQRFENFPLDIESWSCGERGDMSDDVLERLGATDWLICDYVDPESARWINVYVGYHESQVRKYEEGDKVTNIHPPEHCLPGAGWDVIDSQVIPFRSGGLDGEAKRFVIAKGEMRQLVYFWYQSRGRMIARNHEVILYKFLDRATRSRSDGSLVRLTVPITRGDEESADAAVRDFAALFTPLLPPYLPE